MPNVTLKYGHIIITWHRLDVEVRIPRTKRAKLGYGLGWYTGEGWLPLLRLSFLSPEDYSMFTILELQISKLHAYIYVDNYKHPRITGRGEVSEE